MKIFLADKQDITRAGLSYIISDIPESVTQFTEDKSELLEALKQEEDAVVILDYTLFDINDVEELEIIGARFPKTKWILFSEDLILKESSLPEIHEAIMFAMRNHRYICQRMTEMLLVSREVTPEKEQINLTKTEIEILKDIALGMTTKEIAEKRFSSFHTVNTHRKNIFRKLNVNNVHEATKYALRAGLVDSAEYYI